MRDDVEYRDSTALRQASCSTAIIKSGDTVWCFGIGMECSGDDREALM